MNIFKRLKNIWKLGETFDKQIDVNEYYDKKLLEVYPPVVTEPKLAQIIKRVKVDPLDEILKENVD